MRVVPAVLVAFAFQLQAVTAFEVTLVNDSTTGGTPSTVLNTLITGESAAATLTSTCSGDIVAAQVYWASVVGGGPSQIEQSISLFASGAFPTPGPVLLNQGGANAVVVGPTLADGAMNEYRFLDPPANAVPLRVPVTAGQSFVVSLKLFNTSNPPPFGVGPTYDQDGCQAGTNAVDAVPGGWIDACPGGLTGDWVIRAVVDCAPSTAIPAMGSGHSALLFAFIGAVGAVAAAALRRRQTRSRA